MTIEAPDAIIASDNPAHRETPIALDTVRCQPTRHGGRARRLLRLSRWALLLGLVGVNAWWFWCDVHPVAGLDVISNWIDLHRDQEAEHALQKRLERSPHDGEARIMLAKLLAQRNATLASARELHKVPFWWPAKGKWLLMEGAAFKDSGRMSDAEAAWKAVVEDDPLHPVEPKFVTAATRDLLELYAVEGRWDDSIKLIWKSYDRTDDPGEREALLNMRIRTELERIVPAVAAAKMEKYLAADPADWEARRGLAKTLMALHQPEEAKRHVATCIEERPDEPRGWADYLDLLHDTGDLDGLRQAIARLPDPAAEHPGVLKRRAMLMEHDRQWDQAGALYERILRTRPFERETYYRLALVKDRAGQHESAQGHRQRSEAMRAARTELNEAYQKVLDLHQSELNSPKYQTAIRRLAKLCEVLGWKRDAEGWARLVPSE